jgi:uncharacterized transporter YbjL
MGPFPRVEQIESLDGLTEAQRTLLDKALASHPELGPETLVVYRLDDRSALVAPRADTVGVGDAVICTGWTEAYQTASVAEGEVGEVTNLDVASGVKRSWLPHR